MMPLLESVQVVGTGKYRRGKAHPGCTNIREERQMMVFNSSVVSLKSISVNYSKKSQAAKRSCGSSGGIQIISSEEQFA